VGSLTGSVKLSARFLSVEVGLVSFVTRKTNCAHLPKGIHLLVGSSPWKKSLRF
jgi:hypothetical protein